MYSFSLPWTATAPVHPVRGLITTTLGIMKHLCYLVCPVNYELWVIMVIFLINSVLPEWNRRIKFRAIIL